MQSHASATEQPEPAVVISLMASEHSHNSVASAANMAAAKARSAAMHKAIAHWAPGMNIAAQMRAAAIAKRITPVHISAIISANLR
jgi:hypothetical protein